MPARSDLKCSLVLIAPLQHPEKPPQFASPWESSPGFEAAQPPSSQDSFCSHSSLRPCPVLQPFDPVSTLELVPNSILAAAEGKEEGNSLVKRDGKGAEHPEAGKEPQAERGTGWLWNSQQLSALTNAKPPATARNILSHRITMAQGHSTVPGSG